MQFTCPGLS